MVPAEASYVQLVTDLLDTRTLGWKNIIVLHDSSEVDDDTSLREMILQLQKKASVAVFDLSLKSIQEVLDLGSHLGNKFLIIGKKDTALEIFNIVRRGQHSN